MSSETRQSREVAVIEALSCGKSQKDAAAAAGLSARTVARWLETPEFQRRVTVCREQMLEVHTARLGSVVGDAVETLRTLMAETAPPAVRLGAARTVLEQSLKLREVMSIEKRIGELESRLAANKPA